MTRDDLRPAAIAMAETWHHEACKFKAKGSRQCQFWSAHVRTIEGFLDALTPSAKSTLARYLLGDAIDGLDVERLAKGIKSAIVVRLIAGDTSQTYTANEVSVLVAAVVDEQYARLAEPKP